MKSHTHYMWFNTKARQEIIDVSDAVAEQVRESGVREGFVLVSAMHITASVFVNDHESGLWQDILEWLERTVAPWDPSRYRHNQTGERSEEHTSELQSQSNLVCRLLLEKKKKSTRSAPDPAKRT